jgi:hypothetical protein
LFSEFLIESGKNADFEMLPEHELAHNLRQFYCSARTKEGSQYSRSGYRNLRSGIQRHIQSPPYSRTLNLRSDKCFMAANQCYEGMLKDLKRQGKDVTKHKAAIDAHDMQKMYSSGVLSDTDPVALQRKVFVEVGMHFGRRGREGWRSLQKDSFENGIDSQERRFFRLKYNELDKNHQGAEEKEQIMYENPTSDRCPYKSLDKYLEKLNPKCPWFLQRPDPKFRTREYWYVNAPLGVHTIANMLKDISKAASTSKEYTNHCVKATVGTVLKKAGVPSRDIMCVTGHKNVASLDSYLDKPDADERSRMCNIISNFGNNSGEKTKCIPSSSSSQQCETIHIVTTQENAQPSSLTNMASSHLAGATFNGPVTINFNFGK